MGAPRHGPRRAVRVGGLTIVALAASSFASPASAQLASVGRQLEDVAGEITQLERDRLEVSQLRSPTYVEERLTDGELFYRLHDYLRASIIFTDLVENHPRHRAYPDAKFLLADSLYRAGDYYGARRHFQDIVEAHGESRFAPYVQRALGRLIEIAIRTRDFRSVDRYFDQLSRLPPQEVEAATAYYRAKYLYNRAVPAEDVLRAEHTEQGRSHIDLDTLERAREAFQAVPAGSPFYPQARYFIGVVHTLRGEYPQAIDAFQRVLRVPMESPDQRRVEELTYLALGRLYYETDQIERAIEAYQRVPRTSELFPAALYEVAWAYIRMGDSTRADRALEVLGVVAPESRFIPDAKLLRGNLLLREGRFDEANRIFREVRKQFGPVLRRLDQMVEGRDDPRAYFRRLVRENLDTFDPSLFLPEEARRWGRLSGDMSRAMRVLEDLGTARRLVTETESLVERLTAALASPNGVAVFADLRRHRERTTALRNRLARIRRKLLSIEERQHGGGGGELREVRERRRRIERLLGKMPTSPEDFVVRDDRLLSRYESLERELSRLKVELLGLEARITATHRFLEDSRRGWQGTPEAREALERELDLQKQGLETYRREIRRLAGLIEVARLQVGVGDARYRRDDRLRAEYNDLVRRERELMAAAGLRRDPRIEQFFGRIAALEARLDAHDRKVDGILRERVDEMTRIVDEERAKLSGYREALSTLQQEAEDVVGFVAFDNFGGVRRRFYDLVLRADVGRIDVAWARREEHRMRVDMLTRERARELQAIDDEFREVVGEQRSGGTP